MRYYYLYQITNNLNGKIYVGVHQTTNLDDGYMGSGKILRSAMEKYGIENFTKVILETFENAEAMYAREKEVVNDEFLLREDVYNLRRGGNGGFDYINDRSITHIFRAKKGYANSLALLDLSDNAKNSHVKMKENKTGIYSKNFICAWVKSPHFQKMGNSPEAREKAKVSQRKTFALIGHQQGEKNSSYGTCWISHELVGSKKCKKNDLPLYIDQGWIKGRNIFNRGVA